MANDTRPPADDNHLFVDLRERQKYHERRAGDHWDEMGDYKATEPEWLEHLRGFEYHSERARHLRHKLRRGEREPAF